MLLVIPSEIHPSGVSRIASNAPASRASVRRSAATGAVARRLRSKGPQSDQECASRRGAAGYFDARYDTPLAEQGLIEGRLAKDLIPGAQVVCPGDTAKSMLFHRLGLTGETQIPPLQMQPLARNLVDPDALTLFEEWIKSLAPTTKP
jgi:hypothetical protein